MPLRGRTLLGEKPARGSQPWNAHTPTMKRLLALLAVTTAVYVGVAGGAHAAPLPAPLQVPTTAPASAPTVADLVPVTQQTITRATLAPRSREYRAATSSKARNMQGIEPSLYRGEYYAPKKGEDFRLCVIHRESRGHYRAANTTSSARGAYQFLDRAWRKSLIHMLRPEARDNDLLPQLRELADKPIHQWSRYWQDAAFWTVYNRGAGAHHWGTFGRYRDCGA